MSFEELKTKIDTANESKKVLCRLAVEELLKAIKDQCLNENEESAHDYYENVLAKEQRFCTEFDCLSAPCEQVLEDALTYLKGSS